MDEIWTIAGDETSWPEAVNRMATTAASETMRQLVTYLKPGSQQWAIDIGCGAGRAFLPLNEKGYRVIGIDPISEAITASQIRVKDRALSAWPVLATGNHLPLRDESAKAVFAIGTLFHLSPVEMEAALCEIKRVLFVGGEAILHFLDHGDWRQKLGKRRRKDEIPMPSYRAVVTCFCSEDRIRRIIKASGLTIQDSFEKVQIDDEGERRDWFFHCVRDR
jgi:ubiquinone/menaquinone biosynthesis C-methylase UbiE